VPARVRHVCPRRHDHRRPAPDSSPPARGPDSDRAAAAVGCLVLAFTIFPVGYNVWLGFYAKHSLRATSAWVGLGNYAQILTDSDFWRSVWLATVYAVASTALQIVAGVAGALILHRRFAGCDFLRGVALFPYMIPTVIAVFVWRWLMNDLYGVIPYVLSALRIPGMPEAWLTHATIMWVLIVLSVWTFFPFVLVNVLARLQTIPLELYDAARVDGASAVRQFVHVTLPQLRNVLLIVCSCAGSGCSPSSTSRGCSASGEGRGGDPHAARLHLSALVHLLPGGDGGSAVQRDARASPHGGDDLLRGVPARGDETDG
jgi:ABC-type spermidine/putrescine transport system permease subunit II